MKIVDYDALIKEMDNKIEVARNTEYQHDYMTKRTLYENLKNIIDRLAYDRAPVTCKMQKVVRTYADSLLGGCSLLNDALEDGWTVIGNTILSRNGETIVEYILEKEVVVSEDFAGTKNGDKLSKGK